MLKPSSSELLGKASKTEENAAQRCPMGLSGETVGSDFLKSDSMINDSFSMSETSRNCTGKLKEVTCRVCRDWSLTFLSDCRT